MFSSIAKLRKSRPRQFNHGLLAGVALSGLGIAAALAGPDQALVETLSIGSGYVALVLLLVTLLIGPLNMLKVRKNPVNLMFRRDAGIWSGIMALLHVVFSFMIYFSGNLWLYFFKDDGTPALDLFGLSNDVGLIAALVILFLLVLSNNYFLRRLKGKQWKNMQRFNYLLFVVALLHTFGQQLSNNRSLILTFGVMGLAGAVVVAQSIGFVVYRQRERLRKAGPVKVAAKEVVPTTLVPNGLGRRRFLTMTGAVMLTGMAGGLVAAYAANNNSSSAVQASTTTTANPTATTGSSTATATATTNAATATATISPTTTAATTNAATTAATTTAATTNAVTATATSTTAAATKTATATPTATATTAATISGTVLTTLTALPVGSVKQYSRPDTRQVAFVVRETDGSVKSFSGICTHEPFNLVYQAGQNQYYCSKHGATFNAQTGAVTQGPARTNLASLSVKVDGQGNIVYTAA